MAKNKLGSPAIPEGKNEASLLKTMSSVFFNTVFAIVVLFIVVSSVGAAFSLYRLDTVLTGSMRPTYPEGSVVVAVSVPKEKIATGDVLIFRSPEAYGGETVTHRIISASLTERGDVYIRTKGDANNVADPWDALISTENVWVVRGGVPYIGYVATWARSWWPLLLAFGVSMPLFSFANRRVKTTYGGAAE